ncbi:hypothetical protein sS8_3496 [Methylocaldum marinum]|uniref:Uncharacterized protein n=1 Tax=Methylocaldum marinum TaxID=1432792 RepID=A0A250KUT9_9GAMM|nr:hypothetical protein [Methylocaldum marinum]BBA35433.1 hypothetical protein sS8_3496 [Methylocaldum marinum]
MSIRREPGEERDQGFPKLESPIDPLVPMIRRDNGRESFPGVAARSSVCVGKGLPTYDRATL